MPDMSTISTVPVIASKDVSGSMTTTQSPTDDCDIIEQILREAAAGVEAGDVDRLMAMFEKWKTNARKPAFTSGRLSTIQAHSSPKKTTKES